MSPRLEYQSRVLENNPQIHNFLWLPHVKAPDLFGEQFNEVLFSQRLRPPHVPESQFPRICLGQTLDELVKYPLDDSHGHFLFVVKSKLVNRNVHREFEAGLLVGAGLRGHHDVQHKIPLLPLLVKSQDLNFWFQVSSAIDSGGVLGEGPICKVEQPDPSKFHLHHIMIPEQIELKMAFHDPKSKKRSHIHMMETT